jgi:hypothetical protein
LSAAWKSVVSSATGTVGVKSVPPPNQPLERAVRKCRVFMGTTGTLGERMWQISEM